MSKNKHTGNKGETLATDYLLQKGYSLLHRNWRHKHWEIDIIVSKDNRLHFIEVKTRNSGLYGKPEESITWYKMNYLKKAANMYLYLHPEWTRIQFDVIAITLKGEEVEEIFVNEDVYF